MKNNNVENSRVFYTSYIYVYEPQKKFVSLHIVYYIFLNWLNEIFFQYNEISTKKFPSLRNDL